MSWLDDIVESTEEYETPKRFYYWSALAAISAILKDKVWINRGKLYNLYPNIYVLLYGPSGIKKGPAIALAERIVRKVDNTRVINGRASIEAIIKELGTVVVKDKNVKINDSAGFIVASELSSSIISNQSAMDIMTGLYDRMYIEDKWKYKLKVGENVTLTKPTITWLTASNEALFLDFIPEKNMKGGLIGRTYVISEYKRNRINSLMYEPKRFPDYDKLAEDISPITKLKGEFEIPDEVKAAFNAWYIEFSAKYADKLGDESGLVNRIDDMILKVSMLISCGRRGDQLILMEDIIEAMNVCLPLIQPTKQVVSSVKSNEPPTVKKRALIIQELAERAENRASRSELLRKFGRIMDHEDLDRIINYLEQSGAIKIGKYGDNTVYDLNTKNPKIVEFLATYRRK